MGGLNVQVFEGLNCLFHDHIYHGYVACGDFLGRYFAFFFGDLVLCIIQGALGGGDLGCHAFAVCCRDVFTGDEVDEAFEFLACEVLLGDQGVHFFAVDGEIVGHSVQGAFDFGADWFTVDGLGDLVDDQAFIGLGGHVLGRATVSAHLAAASQVWEFLAAAACAGAADDGAAAFMTGGNAAQGPDSVAGAWVFWHGFPLGGVHSRARGDDLLNLVKVFAGDQVADVSLFLEQL